MGRVDTAAVGRDENAAREAGRKGALALTPTPGRIDSGISSGHLADLMH